jgi:hypothetical protein
VMLFFIFLATASTIVSSHQNIKNSNSIEQTQR